MNRLMTRMSQLIRNRRDQVQAAPLLPALNREFISRHFVGGTGLEIGALHNPMPVSPGTIVRYVDRLPVDDLRRQYPELAALPLVPLDIIDNGETLATIADASQDFVIANHFLEHCEDPIGTVKTFHRVLRQNGVLYLAIPEKTSTFDRDRPVTSLGHLLHDHQHGPAASREAHFREWALLVDKRVDDLEAHVEQLLRKNYSIHFHVWDQQRWLEFVTLLQQMIGFRLELVCQHGIELITVLRK